MSVRDIDLDPDKVFGIGFPLNYDSQAAGFFTQNKKYYQQIQDNIKNLLMTSKGERPGNVEFGSDLRYVIFEQNEPASLKESVEEILDLTVYLGAVLLETKNTRDADSKQNRKQVNPEEIKMMLKGLHMLQSESYRENQMQYANKVGDLIKNIKESCKWSEEDEKSIGRSNTINTEQVTGPTKCIEGSNCD